MRNISQEANLDNIHVSVIMAVKNEEKYILEAVGSILRQKSINHELIVVDDNSTDDTFQIVNDKYSSETKFNIFRSPGNGKVAAFNFGVTRAKGRYVCLFAGDDIMPKDSLSERFNVLNNNKNQRYVVGLSKIKIMSDNKRKNGLIVPRKKNRGSLSGQSPLMDSDVVQFLFPIPEDLPNEDTWLEIAFGHTSKFNIIHSDIICCNWRMHSGNSMNMLVSYNEYKQKMVLRRSAFGLFLERYSDTLVNNEINNIKEMVKGIHCYKNEDVLGLLRTKSNIIWKIRILSTINPFFYKIRTMFYSFLTGW